MWAHQRTLASDEERAFGQADRPWEAARGREDAAQRALDIALALLILPIAVVLILPLAAAVRLDSPGPAFFRQTRLGRGGRPFTLYKLRSMAAGADPEPHRRHVSRLLRGRDRGEAWQGKAGDDRVTRLGRLLRRSGLDELPQLVNILRGEMSLVGPRPALPYEAELWAPWHHGRLAVRPGLTGPWQLAACHQAMDFDSMVRLDLDYIRRRSLWRDLTILALTPLALLRRCA